jgi:hypothetical protein
MIDIARWGKTCEEVVRDNIVERLFIKVRERHCANTGHVSGTLKEESVALVRFVGLVVWSWSRRV